jgi:D-ribulokinase
VSGGAAQSPLVRQILADATGLTVAATDAEEPVLVGAVILGALAFGNFADASAAMSAMSVLSQTYEPQTATRAWHDARSAAYGALQDAARSVRGIR